MYLAINAGATPSPLKFIVASEASEAMTKLEFELPFIGVYVTVKVCSALGARFVAPCGVTEKAAEGVETDAMFKAVSPVFRTLNDLYTDVPTVTVPKSSRGGVKGVLSRFSSVICG